MRYHAYPTESVVSVADVATLAAWIGTDATDPLLPILGQSATAAVIEFLQSELINRTRVVVYDQWPTEGTPTPSSLSPSDACLSFRFELPYARLQSVTEVQLYGETVAASEYKAIGQFPDALEVDSIPGQPSEYAPAAKITYVAGYGVDASAVPAEIITAVMMAAAYQYEHRGECDAKSAIKMSGADAALTPYRARVVLL